MNEDCIYLILNQLDFQEIINVAQSSKKLSILAVDVFKRQFAVEKIVINVLDVKKEAYRFTKNHEIFDYKLALNVLKYVGHVIRKLEMCYHINNPKNTAVISRFINEYCHESLIEFDFQLVDQSPIYSMTKPFKNVQHVDLTIFWSLQGDETLAMNELFPALRRFTLNFYYAQNDYINCHFPLLEYFHVNKSPPEFDRSPIKDFLAANSHIRRLSLGTTTMEFLKIIQIALPSLENLTLWYYLEEYEPIHFESVTIFTIKDYWSPKNISFSHLQELHINVEGERSMRWINFIKTNQNINRFFMDYSFVDDEHFETLSKHLMNIVEMSIVYRRGKRFSSDAIIGFMNENVRLFKLNLDSCTETDKKNYHDKLEEELTITENDITTGLSFERRQRKNF